MTRGISFFAGAAAFIAFASGSFAQTLPSGSGAMVPVSANGPRTNAVQFSSSGTYTPSAGMVFADVYLIGPGGGGGGGALQAASTACSGGSGGVIFDENEDVMHHLWRGGNDLRGVHPAVFG